MAELKTQRNDASVDEFLDSVENPRRQSDCRTVVALMKDITGETPTMWGDSIVGFGEYQYKYKSGRAGEWFLTGVSPRKQSLTLYIMPGFSRYDELLARLGKHKTGTSCLYINKLDDIDHDVLRELVEQSVIRMRNKS